MAWHSAWSAAVPAGFIAETIAEGINAGTALSIDSKGTVYFAEQTGHIRIVRDGRLLPTPLLDISARLDAHWERGLIGMELDPAFPRKPYLFVVYTEKEPHPRHVVSRFTVRADVARLSSEKILFRGDNQDELGGAVDGAHQGGPIRIGPDDKLYFGIGEQTNDPESQSKNTLLGKILRINRDGSIPSDNPFYDELEGKYRAIYATGIRNPFGLAFQPGTGRLFEADIGKSSFDEINEIHAGANYGWPLAEGPSDNPEFTNPIHVYPPAIGRSICGSAFYPVAGNFPDVWKGKLFFVDWAANWVKAIDVDDPERAIDFGAEFDNPVAVEASPRGSLWILNRGTRWRDGKKFENNSGSLTRISFAGERYTGGSRPDYPETMGATGLASGTRPFSLVSGFEPFELNAPYWRPGVVSEQWIRIPGSGKIRVAGDEWIFPKETVIVQHFKDPHGKDFESHVYHANGDGTFKAAAYDWSAEGGDAVLVESTRVRPSNGAPGEMWLSPGPVSKLDPSSAVFGFIPQFSPRQLNGPQQLRAWIERGWFAKPAGRKALERQPRLSRLEDDSHSKVDRIRSYLDSNCASCHKPGGASRGYFDARFSTNLENQMLIEGDLMAGDLGIDGARLVAPGAPEKSILYERLSRKDGYRMPPGALTGEDPPVLSLLEDWIKELGESDPGQ